MIKSFYLFCNLFHHHIYSFEQLQQQQSLAHFLPLYLVPASLPEDPTTDTRPARAAACETVLSVPQFLRITQLTEAQEKVCSSSSRQDPDSLITSHCVPINGIQIYWSIKSINILIWEWILEPKDLVSEVWIF